MEPMVKIPILLDGMDRMRDSAKMNPRSPEELKKVCRDFEALFLEQLLKIMRKSIPKGGLLDGGQQEEIYTMLFDRELAQRMAERGIGLAELMQRQLERAER